MAILPRSGEHDIDFDSVFTRGGAPNLEDLPRETLIFKRCDRYQDFGPDAGRGLPALRGGLPCSLPPNTLLDLSFSLACQLELSFTFGLAFV